MRRRVFIQSGSAAAVLALAGCGGGGGGSLQASSSSDAAGGETSPASALATRPQVAGDVAYPFGARLDPYVAGIRSTAGSTTEMDSAVKSCYDRWKAKAVVDVPNIGGGKAVKFNSPDFITVSEGVGYGMLITVVMAGYDGDAKTNFDGLFRTVRARPALGMAKYFGPQARNLMDWRLKADGDSSDPDNLGASACDGDMDIAMALLMAHRQWGSNGEINYLQEARATISALKAINMRPDGQVSGSPQPHVTRTSDFMIGHFRAFAAATSDSFWSNTAINRCYDLVNQMQTKFSPDAGLTPDFIINCDTDPVPSPGGFGDFTNTEGFYYANAQRNPWRWASDYVLSGDGRWQAVTNKLVSFIKQDCGGDPTRIGDGYHLDGSPVERSYPPKGIIGPMMCGAMVDGSHQAFANALFSWTVSNFTTDYYDSELQLLPLIVASGNWWKP